MPNFDPGTATCYRLAEAFYGKVDKDPILRLFFPGKSLHCAIEELSAFLVQFLGGPDTDSQRRWHVGLHHSHRRFRIGESARHAWLAAMSAAIDDIQLQEPHRTRLQAFFEHASTHIVNQGDPPAPTAAIPVEYAQRWNLELILDEIVAALSTHDDARAVELSATVSTAAVGLSVVNGLLARLLRTQRPALQAHVHARLRQEPAMANARYGGRTLLHEAAALGDLPTVLLLLELGVDPNIPDASDHAPLYSLANGCLVGGGEIVHALVRAGANVNAQEGIQRCAPLHMAARRDSVDAAKALLECGATVDIRDKANDTPLRRAVNCNQPGMARLLLAAGANPNSRGSKGLTPRTAARTAEMRAILGI